MVDIDGKFTYSQVFSGGCNDLPMEFVISSNPVRNTAVARVSAKKDTKAVLQLYAVTGQLLMSQSWPIGTGLIVYPLM